MVFDEQDTHRFLPIEAFGGGGVYRRNAVCEGLKQFENSQHASMLCWRQLYER
jgi:hypothetical protein